MGRRNGALLHMQYVRQPLSQEVAITDILLAVRKIVVELGYRAVPNSLRT
jgi:hypothetical protein